MWLVMYPLYGWKITDVLEKIAEEESQHLTSNHIHSSMIIIYRRKVMSFNKEKSREENV